jgi:hypothetical protein
MYSPTISSVLDAREGVTFRPWPFYPWVKTSDAGLRRGIVGPSVGVDVSENRKTSCPCTESNPGSSSLYHSHYTD